MTGYTVAWIIWLAMFFAIEFTALKRTQGETFSAYVWRWASVKNKSKGWQIRRLTLLATMAWLTIRFLAGGRYL
jgi:hypothetical protein